MDEDTFRSILEKMLLKARSNKIEWIEEFGRPGVETFVVLFPAESCIKISYEPNKSSPDYIGASLWVGNHNAVSINVEEGNSADWYLLKALATEARSRIYGFNDALRAIEEALSSDDTLGQLPLSDKPTPPSNESPFL